MEDKWFMIMMSQNSKFEKEIKYISRYWENLSTYESLLLLNEVQERTET